MANQNLIISNDDIKNIGTKNAAFMATNRGKDLVQRYKKFQTASVVQFLNTWMKDLRLYAGNKKIVFLANNFGGSWNEIFRVFDAGIAEMSGKKYKFYQVNSCCCKYKKSGQKSSIYF
jgi:hypothetical protein